MQFIIDIITTVLTAYLAFTNTLAVEISTWFENDHDTKEPSSLHLEESSLPTLTPHQNPSIPDILLKSATYQQASLSDSTGLTGASTDNPLEALVNIFCTFTNDKLVRTTTGTGVFIDPDGIILTNAHVAQFLLLSKTADGSETKCIIRSGNPATPTYQAELLFISPTWIQQNAHVMNSDVPMGTGENDYALLYVNRSIYDSPLPAVFPALNIDTALLPNSSKNTEITATAYPATNLLNNGPQADLIPQKATSTISELYTFGSSNQADVFSIHGSAVGTEGSSGGPITNQNGKVIGIIVTRGDDMIDGAGSLRAITISHINDTILQETGFTLKENLNGNLPHRGNIFLETLAPFLIRLLQS